MARTEVPTYVTNQLVTAAHANTYWRDNLNELWPFTTAGDLAYASAAATLARLAIGNTGHVVKSNGSLPVWDAVERTIHWRIVPNTVDISIGDGADYFTIPSDLNGCNLVDADAAVDTPSTSGLPSIMIRNVTQTADMLTTPITIDENEYNSFTAATQPVIDTSNDHVVTGDRIAVDVDAIGTGTKGLVVILRFELP